MKALICGAGIVGLSWGPGYEPRRPWGSSRGCGN